MTGDAKHALIFRVQQVMGWNQRDLAEVLGVSVRTLQRQRGSGLSPGNIATVAKHVHPVDRDLAAQLVGLRGQTLVGAGLEPPPLPVPHMQTLVAPALPQISVPISRPRLAHSDLLDAIVCSVADASNEVPKVVRPLVLLTLRRAVKVGLDLESASKDGALDEEPADESE